MPTADTTTPLQDEETVRQNRRFFSGNERYRRLLRTLETQRNVNEAISQELLGVGRLLDVGNGGVFEYDTGLVDEITAVDLFLDDIDPATVPTNVRLRQGSVLALEDPAETYDAVLLAMVIHHLTGPDARSTVANVEQAIRECTRVLKPGGKLVVADAFVPGWFFRLETLAFPLLRLAPRAVGHPPAMQHTLKRTGSLMARGLAGVRSRRIPTGAFLLIYGLPVPVLLTPTRPALIVGHKR